MKAKKGKTSNKNKKLEEVLIQVGLRIAKEERHYLLLEKLNIPFN